MFENLDVWQITSWAKSTFQKKEDSCTRTNIVIYLETLKKIIILSFFFLIFPHDTLVTMVAI